MVYSNYMNFIQQRHAAGQKCKYLSHSYHLLLQETWFQIRQIWMMILKKKHIRLPQYRQILQKDPLILIWGVDRVYWEWPQSATITHNNCCLHAFFTANGTSQRGKWQDVTLQSCSTIKSLLIEGRGSFICHHHLEMAPRHLHTQMAHSSKSTPVWGWEKTIKIGEVLKEALSSQLSIKKAKWGGKR